MGDEALRSQVARIGVLYRPGWDRNRFNEYVKALSRFTASQVEAAIDLSIERIDSPFAPSIKWFLDAIDEPVREERARRTQARYEKFLATGDTVHLLRRE